MEVEQKSAKRDGLTVIGKVVACAAVVMSGSFMVLKYTGRASAGETKAVVDVCHQVQATGDGLTVSEAAAAGCF